MRAPRDGRFIEIIGHFNPRKYPDSIVLQEDRAMYWITEGAQPTLAVHKLLTRKEIFKKLKERGDKDEGID